ncbi:MAG TPA: phosphatase PAP2 family protein [Candidatus Eisenbacteria bacterium]|nr:phosphatase PAP2 family protein [Candidatus Eisenbacteria bacterium]
MVRFDAEMFRGINNLAGRYPALDAVGVFCARWLIVVMFAAVIVRAFIAARRPESRTLAASLTVVEVRALVAAALAFLGNWLFSLLVFRPRPYSSLKDVHLIVPPPLTPHAFPSGHSSAAFALAFTLLLVDPPFGIAMLVAASFVALGRVFVGVHYPLDVFMGVFVGLFWALVLHGVGTRLHDLEAMRRFLVRKLGRS